jgi:hypothetical protein
MIFFESHNIGDRVLVGGGWLACKVEGTVVGIDNGNGYNGRHYLVRVEKLLRDAHPTTQVGDIYRARYDAVFSCSVEA